MKILQLVEMIGCAVLAGSAWAGVSSQRYRYVNAGHGLQNCIAQRSQAGALSTPFVTTASQLFAEDLELEELLNAQFTGYMIGKSISGPTFLTAAKVFPYYKGTNKLQGLLVTFQKASDGGWHKAVLLRFERGPGGVYVKVDRSGYTKNTFNADTFFNMDNNGNVSYKSGVNAGLISTGTTIDGYGICALQAQVFVPKTGSMLAFANPAGSPVLTLDDLGSDYQFTAVLQGGSINKNNGVNSRDVLVARATNLLYKRNADTDALEQLVVELPIKNDSGKWIKCPVVSLTNGVDGVYASILTVRYAGGGSGLGYRFVNDIGSYNGNDSGSASDGVDVGGYGVTGLTATYKGTAKPEPAVRAVYGDRRPVVPNTENAANGNSGPILTKTPQLVFPALTLADIATANMQAFGIGGPMAKTTLNNCFTQTHLGQDGAIDFAISVFEAFDDQFIKAVVVKFTQRAEGVYAQLIDARFKQVGRDAAARAKAGTIQFATLNADGSITYTENQGIIGETTSAVGYGLRGLQIVHPLSVTTPVPVFARGADESALTLDNLDDYVISGFTVGSSFGTMGARNEVPAMNVKRWRNEDNGSVTSLVYEVQVQDDNYIKCAVVELLNGANGVEGHVVTNFHRNLSQAKYGEPFVNADRTYCTNLIATEGPTAFIYNPNYGVANLRAVPNDFVEVARWMGTTSADRTLPANWRCSNRGNELPGRVPTADSRVEIGGLVRNFQAPAGEALPYAKVTVVSSVLQENCDWRGLGVAEVPYQETWSLNGKALTVAGLTGWGTINGAGTLTLDIAEGVTNRNATVAIAGATALVKAGEGTYVAAKAQSAAANVTVAEGTVVVENATGLGSLAAAKLTVAAEGALEVAAAMTVKDLELNGEGRGEAAVTVTGTYAPNGDSQPYMVLAATATVDLTGRTTPWNAEGTTFPAGELPLKISGRNAKSGTWLIRWDAQPEGVTFTTDDEKVNKLGLLANARGLLVQGGMAIFVR